MYYLNKNEDDLLNDEKTFSDNLIDNLNSFIDETNINIESEL